MIGPGVFDQLIGVQYIIPNLAAEIDIELDAVAAENACADRFFILVTDAQYLAPVDGEGQWNDIELVSIRSRIGGAVAPITAECDLPQRFVCAGLGAFCRGAQAVCRNHDQQNYDCRRARCA